MEIPGLNCRNAEVGVPYEKSPWSGCSTGKNGIFDYSRVEKNLMVRTIWLV